MSFWVSDNVEFSAQVRATVTHHQGRPSKPSPGKNSADLQLPGDPVHRRYCLSKRRGESVMRSSSTPPFRFDLNNLRSELVTNFSYQANWLQMLTI